MASSIYDTILNAVQSQIQALGLTFNNVSVPVVVRKLPRTEETIDGTLPLICVAPRDAPERVEPFSSEDQWRVVYPVEIVVINSGNRDFTDSNLDAELRFREQIRRLFQGVNITAMPTVYRTEIRPSAALDRTRLAKQYEYLSLTVWFHSVEPRTN